MANQEVRQRRGRKEQRDQQPRFGTVSSAALPGGAGRDPYEAADGDFVTPMERAAFRERKTAAWARTMPLRIQQFLQQSGADVAMRIFKEVVVRFPIHHGTQEEVLALLEPYGNVEYVSGPNTKGDRKKKTTSSAPAGGRQEGEDSTTTRSGATVGVEDEVGSFCHLVRFEEGADAVRCFFSLNGALIDPQQHKMLLDNVKEAYRQMQLDAGASAEDIDDTLPDELQLPLMACADKTRHIFITVDFFRLAFVMPSDDRKKSGGAKSRTPGTKSSVGDLIPARASLISMLPSHRAAGPSISLLHEQLHATALKMDDVYGLLSSRGVEWEEFCFLVNFFSFLNAQFIPTYRGEEAVLGEAAAKGSEKNKKEAATAGGGQAHTDYEEFQKFPSLATAHISPDEMIPSLSIAGSVRTVYRAMKHTQWDCTRVLSWVDRCSPDSGEKRLIEGQVNTVQGGPRGGFWQGAHQPLVKQLALLLVLTLALILVLKWLV